MPTYEYACSSCGHRFDVRQGFSDAPITDCPQCGATVRRVLYPAGVIFKGTGWYKTDSRAASHSEATTKPSSGEGTPTPQADSSESKASEPKKTESVKPAADD
jgi:putative FmdB family regulatory protein